MKDISNLITIILFLCFVAIAVPSVDAQRKRANTRKKQAVSSEVQKNVQSYPIKTEYDKFKDETIVKMFIGVGNGHLLFGFSHKGRYLVGEPASISFNYMEPSRKYVTYGVTMVDYYVLADGYRIKRSPKEELLLA